MNSPVGPDVVTGTASAELRNWEVCECVWGVGVELLGDGVGVGGAMSYWGGWRSPGSSYPGDASESIQDVCPFQVCR